MIRLTAYFKTKAGKNTELNLDLNLGGKRSAV